MAEVFALKQGSMRGVVDLIQPLLEIRFKKIMVKELGRPWYLATSKDGREQLAVFPNETASGRDIDASTDGYEVILYLVRSPREEKITRMLSTETRLRFVRPSNRVLEFADAILAQPADSLAPFRTSDEVKNPSE